MFELGKSMHQLWLCEGNRGDGGKVGSQKDVFCMFALNAPSCFAFPIWHCWGGQCNIGKVLLVDSDLRSLGIPLGNHQFAVECFEGLQFTRSKS